MNVKHLIFYQYLYKETPKCRDRRIQLEVNFAIELRFKYYLFVHKFNVNSHKNFVIIITNFFLLRRPKLVLKLNNKLMLYTVFAATTSPQHRIRHIILSTIFSILTF